MNNYACRRRYLATVGATSIGVLGGCINGGVLGDGAQPATDDYPEGWTTFKGDPKNSGVRPADDGPRSSVSRAWELNWRAIIEEIEGENADEISPSASHGTSNLREQGALIGAEFSDPVLTPSGVVCSVGYRWFDPETEIESERVAAIGVDQSSGAIRWSHPLHEIRSETIEQDEAGSRTFGHLDWFGAEVVDGTVVVSSLTDSGVTVVVLEDETGERVDDLNLGLSETCTRPRVADGMLFAVDKQRLRAFDLESGAEEWDTEVSVTPDGVELKQPALSIADDLVWTVEHGTPTEIVAREIRDGNETIREPIALDEFRMQTDLPDETLPTLGELSFGPEYAYTAGDDHSRTLAVGAPLLAIDPTDGTERWRFGPSDIESEGVAIDGLYGHPVATDGSVIIAGWSASDGEGRGSYLFSVDATDGSLEWSLPIDTHAFAPVVAGETIYIETATMSAVSLDGERLDSLERNPVPPHQCPPALGNGRLFVGGIGSLIAIE